MRAGPVVVPTAAAGPSLLAALLRAKSLGMGALSTPLHAGKDKRLPARASARRETPGWGRRLGSARVTVARKSRARASDGSRGGKPENPGAVDRNHGHERRPQRECPLAGITT